MDQEVGAALSFTPHKFRHGHAVYALKLAKDVSALKAVSQNLMHQNLLVTDGVYGILSESDVRQRIVGLAAGSPDDGSHNLGELIELTKALIKRLEGK